MTTAQEPPQDEKYRRLRATIARVAANGGTDH